MSGRGKRETMLRADAARWLDRVLADMASPAGIAALTEYGVSVDALAEFANEIAGHLAAGDDLTETRSAPSRRVADWLVARGHVMRVGTGLVRPVRAGKLI
jgi:hypothetical protein